MGDKTKLIPEMSPQEKRAMLAELLRQRTAVQPLSHAQRSQWFMYRLAPQSSAYNVAFVGRIAQPVHLPGLQRAVDTIFSRHATLRTTYELRDGEPVQVVHPRAPGKIEVVDTESWDDQRLADELHSEAHRPFDLEHGPVLRAKLFSRSNQEHYVSFVFHHIVIDFWSIQVFVEELCAVYEAELKGRDAALPPLSRQYFDYVRWHNELLSGDHGKRLEQYWTKQLLEPLPVLDLPTDYPRPAVQTFNGNFHDVEIGGRLLERLRELAKQSDATLYVVLLAALNVLLARLSGQTDILIACPTACRPATDFESLIGFFANPVVIRTDLAADLGVKDLLAQVRDTVWAGLEHQLYPFSLLVERLNIDRAANRSPICDVFFVWEKPHERAGVGSSVLAQKNTPAATGQFAIQMQSIDQVGAASDLVMAVFERASHLHVRIRYNRDLFTKTTAERFARQYEALLQSIAADANRRVSELSILSAEERRCVIEDFNRTEVAPSFTNLVHEMVSMQAEHAPDSLALWDDRTRLTYGELNRRANQYAHHLRRLGAGRDQLVAVCLPRSVEMVVALLGILKAGAAYVPLDPSYPDERLQFMVSDAGAQILITRASITGRFTGQVPHVVAVGSTEESVEHEATMNPEIPVAANDLAYVIYTSGSTGKPKGVEIEHGGLWNLVNWHVRRYGVGPEDRATQVASAGFDASVWELWPYLAAGASIRIISDELRLSPGALWRFLAAERITLSFLPTPLAEACLREPLPGDLRLRALLTGGDRLHAGNRRQLPFELVNHYGPTENAVVATATTVNQEEQEPPIGRPIDRTQAYVLDANREPVPVGVRGELYIGGASLARG